MKQNGVLVMQAGGSTPVMNRSLFGIVREASEHKEFGELYGAVHALDGVLSERFADLGRQTRAQWDRIARTPGAALGSSRRKLRSQNILTLVDVLSKRGIRYCFIIGGNDSAETGYRIGTETRNAGMPLTVINVPKTIDNDLLHTDHSPGYGSAARFVALATMGAGRDNETMGEESPVTIIEVMGRDAGWLAAAAALAKRDEMDAPHVICVPEAPVDERRFLDLIENAYRRFGFAVAVVAENARGTDGVLGAKQEPWYVDDFGHAYYEGAGRYLAMLVGSHLNTRVRYEKPGTIQRSMAACVSGTDAREAEMVGRAAVRYALEGETGKMVTLVRGGDSDYVCTTGLAPLKKVAGMVKRMPGEYFDHADFAATQRFIDYARPLIGGPLPHFGRVCNRR